jgi:hypothetical protein
MRHSWLHALFIMHFLSCPNAFAQNSVPPGFHERELAQAIRQAGYDCREVERVDVTTVPDPAFESLRPEIAVCNGGKRFLVARSGRGGVNARPVVHPLPAENRI